MQNDMMIAALNKQRQGKMDMPIQDKEQADKPQGIEERLSVLEDQYKELCDFVGMNDNKEAPKDTPRGY